MLLGSLSLLCLCLVAMEPIQKTVAQETIIVTPNMKDLLEEKVMSAMSLKHLESMVENDESVRNAPKSKIIIIRKNAEGEDGDAYIIQRKPQKPYRQPEDFEHRFDDVNFDGGVRRSSYDPEFEFENGLRRREEDFPFHFEKMADLESAASFPAQQFYESIIGRIMGDRNFGHEIDPAFAVLEAAASEDVPQYKPRFDYDAYSKDSTETKLRGKPYWKDAPERKDEMIDENGCRTVIKKMIDPEDEKKSSSEKAKSVVITKECEYPNLNGPDAKITEANPLRQDNSRFDSEPSSEYASYDNEPVTYEKTRPEELNFKQTETRDPLAPDYIDTMLEKHFKSFPGFTNPLSSFKGYQERFKLRAPEAFKDVKPSVGVQTYEYSHPKSGFDEERQSTSAAKESASGNSPKTYEHHYHYDYPENNPRKPENNDEDDDERERKPGAKPAKEPKMLKKSFAYYRKDNPKSDPNDQQYAEEYAQGNFRSFSSSYDSEKDGPKKKQKAVE